MNSLSILLARNLSEEDVVEVLDEESVAPKQRKQDSGLFTEEWPDDPPMNSVLVFCHLELLRVSLSSDHQLTQVSKLSILSP